MALELLRHIPGRAVARAFRHDRSMRCYDVSRDLAVHKAVCRHWWELLGCAAFPVLGVGLAADQKNDRAAFFSYILAGLLLIVAFYKAWAEQARQVDGLTASALIRGDVTEVYRIIYTQFEAPVMLYASMVNDSSVSPTIREFICEIETDAGVFSARSSDDAPIKGVIVYSDLDSSSDRGPLRNLSELNRTPLAKYNHREGWLKFTFNGLPDELPQLVRKLQHVLSVFAQNLHGKWIVED